MSGNLSSIAVARSADLRLEVWAVAQEGLLTRWKGAAAEDAGWTSWQSFPSPADSKGASLTPTYLFAGQLISAANNQPGAGRVELWGLDESQLSTTLKSSEQPSAPWGPWSDFSLPPPLVPADPYWLAEGGVVALSDGRLQVFVSIYGGPLYGIWSTVQTSAQWNGGWSEWQHFSLPGPGGSTEGTDFTVCQLPDGQTQLWAIGPSPSGESVAVWTMIRDSAPGDLTNPLSGWGPWSLFEVPVATNSPPTIVAPVGALRAATDGQGRAYLWVNNGALTNPVWQYTYTSTSGSPVVWNPLIEFPTPQSAEVSSNAVIAVGLLPAGVMQVFFLNSPADASITYAQKLWTSWQEVGEPPTSWTSWEDFTP